MTSLTQWGRATHICVSKLTTIGSDNGLSPGWRQAITLTNAGVLLIGPLGTNFGEHLIIIFIFSFKNMYFKMSENLRPFCLGLNVLGQTLHWFKWQPHIDVSTLLEGGVVDIYFLYGRYSSWYAQDEYDLVINISCVLSNSNVYLQWCQSM